MKITPEGSKRIYEGKCLISYLKNVKVLLVYTLWRVFCHYVQLTLKSELGARFSIVLSQAYVTSVPRQNVWRQIVRRQNVRGQNVSGDKTSVGTKRPWGQNVRGDKTSIATKRPWGQNVRRTKHLWGQNINGDKTSVWVIFTKALLGKIFY
jgi:hypothetical protein